MNQNDDRPARPGDRRLSRRVRNIVLIMHIAAGVGWMGIDIALLALLPTALLTDDAHLAAACYLAARVAVPIPVTALSVVMLISGVVLGRGTRWGLLRYWWVAVKFGLGTVLVVLVLVALDPSVLALPDATGLATADQVRAAAGPARVQLLFPPVVSFLALGTALVLSVVKPGGRTPRGRRLAAATSR